MSIVESSIQRLKGARAEGRAAVAPREVVAPRESEPPPAPVTVRWPADPEPVSIDTTRLTQRGLCAQGPFLRRQQEDYRLIRRQVTSASRQRPSPDQPPVGPIVVVTSALDGEGKTYTALNLALSFASELDGDVLLIDGDTTRHRLSSALGIANTDGLLQALERRDGDVISMTRATSLGRLHVLSAGARREGADDIASLARVGPLFDSLRTALEGHTIIVDSPPVLLSSGAALLAECAGQVLFVVRAGVTPQNLVQQAIGQIRESVPVGLVLNDWTPVNSEEHYAYTRYYGEMSP